jgi:hypothetical protein
MATHDVQKNILEVFIKKKISIWGYLIDYSCMYSHNTNS